MFKNNKINPKMIPQIQPTSIASLKAQCLQASDGDITKAKQLYDYFVDGVEGLPLFDPKEPTKMEKVKEFVGNGVGWIKENQNEILQVVGVFQGLFKNKGVGVATALAASPIDEVAGATVASAVASNATQPLDSIN